MKVLRTSVCFIIPLIDVNAFTSIKCVCVTMDRAFIDTELREGFDSLPIGGMSSARTLVLLASRMT